MTRLRAGHTGRTRAGIAVICLLAAGALGLSGCGSDTADTDPSSSAGTALTASAPPNDVAEPTITEDQMIFVDELLADPLTLDEATAMIEAAGYIWRIGEIDGEGRPLTTDYVVDRLTLFVQDDTVVRAVWG